MDEDEDESNRSWCWQVEDEEEGHEEEVEDVAHTRDYTGCRLLIKAATEIRSMSVCVCVQTRWGSHPKVPGNHGFLSELALLVGTVRLSESAGSGWK